MLKDITNVAPCAGNSEFDFPPIITPSKLGGAAIRRLKKHRRSVNDDYQSNNVVLDQPVNRPSVNCVENDASSPDPPFGHRIASMSQKPPPPDVPMPPYPTSPTSIFDPYTTLASPNSLRFLGIGARRVLDPSMPRSSPTHPPLASSSSSHHPISHMAADPMATHGCPIANGPNVESTAIRLQQHAASRAKKDAAARSALNAKTIQTSSSAPTSSAGSNTMWLHSKAPSSSSALMDPSGCKVTSSRSRSSSHAAQTIASQPMQARTAVHRICSTSVSASVEAPVVVFDFAHVFPVEDGEAWRASSFTEFAMAIAAHSMAECKKRLKIAFHEQSSRSTVHALHAAMLRARNSELEVSVALAESKREDADAAAVAQLTDVTRQLKAAESACAADAARADATEAALQAESAARQQAADAYAIVVAEREALRAETTADRARQTNMFETLSLEMVEASARHVVSTEYHALLIAFHCDAQREQGRLLQQATAAAVASNQAADERAKVASREASALRTMCRAYGVHDAAIAKAVASASSLAFAPQAAEIADSARAAYEGVISGLRAALAASDAELSRLREVMSSDLAHERQRLENELQLLAPNVDGDCAGCL